MANTASINLTLRYRRKAEDAGCGHRIVSAMESIMSTFANSGCSPDMSSWAHVDLERPRLDIAQQQNASKKCPCRRMHIVYEE